MRNEIASASPPASAHQRNHFVTRAAIFAGLGGVLFGYDTGVIGGALPLIAHDFDWNSPFLRGVITSSLLLGAAAGALAAGRLTDRLGRRRLILITSVVFLVGILGAALAPDAVVLVVFRVVIGLGVGSASVVVPLYIGEVAPPSARGALVSLNQLSVTIGILVSQLIAYFLTSSGQWRWMIAIALVPAALLGVGMLAHPESPAWLVRGGQEDQARSVLKRIRSNDDDIEGEIRDIRGVASEEVSGREMLGRAVRPALVVGLALAVIQQVTGVNTVIYYAPTLLESAGLGSHAAIGATVIVGAINVLFTIIAVMVLDRIGRRPPLLAGTVGMVVGLGVLGAVFLGQPDAVSHTRAVIAIIALCVYISSFAIGLGPVFWLLISEIYPLRMRGSAMSAAGIANWLANFVVAISFLSLISAIGRSATFWIYGGIAAASLVFMWLRVPETRGRSLPEIEADLNMAPSRSERQPRPPTRHGRPHGSAA
jgi:sugar porter (SP) family MFS transporter